MLGYRSTSIDLLTEGTKKSVRVMEVSSYGGFELQRLAFDAFIMQKI